MSISHYALTALDFRFQMHSEMGAMFHAIRLAVLRAYAEGRDKMTELGRDPFAVQHLGSFVKAFVDCRVAEAIELLSFPDVHVLRVKNANGSQLHLEIRTPYGVFVVLKASNSLLLPRPTKYRKQMLSLYGYSEQISFDAESGELIIPEVSFPLFVITHRPAPGYTDLSQLVIGEIDPSQESWIYCCDLSHYCEPIAAERIDQDALTPLQPQEIIVPSAIRLKK